MMELDDAYANAPYVPGADAIPSQWAARSKTLRTKLGSRAELAVPYGEGERHFVDFFHPESTPKGTLFFIHGGYWLKFGPRDFSFLARGALERGWCVAMPGYDLCPSVRIADISRQIAQSLAMVSNRTTGPISVAGHSAGGHLASRMLDKELVPAAIAERFQMVVPISPLSDLRPLMKTSMNADFKMTEDAAIAESPVFMTSRHSTQTHTFVGADERPAFLDHAEWLSKAWAIPKTVLPGRNHFDVIEPLCEPDSELVQLLTA